MKVTYPEPPISACVEWVAKTMRHNKPYARECIDLWRNTFGDSFADKVAREVGKECRRNKWQNPLDD